MICESHIVKEEIVFRFRKFRVSICIFLYLIVICDQMLLFMKGLVTAEIGQNMIVILIEFADMNFDVN